MTRHKTLTDKMMNEVIFYGGIPVTRATAYRHALIVTGSREAADIFAFGSEKLAPDGTKPLPLEFVLMITLEQT